MSKKTPKRRKTGKRPALAAPYGVASSITPDLMKMLEARFGCAIERAEPLPPVDYRQTTASATRTTAFHAADETLSAMRALSERVCTLADRLVGCVPESSGEKVTPAPASALFGALDAAARDGLHRIAQANEALSRIEASLP